MVSSIALTALCAAASLQAKSLVIDLDPTETKIAYALSATLHIVHGTFRLQSGHIVYDPSTHAISGEVTVSAASGESGNAIRDRRMRREVLQVQRYPEVRFRPAECSGPVVINGVSHVEITGLLMIHGAAHQIAVPMEVQWSHERVTAKGAFIVPYVNWGMKNPSRFLLKVAKNVDIDITAVGQVRQGDEK